MIYSHGFIDVFFIARVQPVTKDQAASKKSRVLVKKYRKKTLAEQRPGRSTDELETNLSEESQADPQKDEVAEKHNRDNAYNTNTTIGWDGEDPTNENCRSEGENLPSDVDRKPTMVCFSQDGERRLNSFEQSPVELDNVSTLDEEDTAAERYAHDTDEEEGMSMDFCKAPFFKIKPNVESENTTVERGSYKYVENNVVMNCDAITVDKSKNFETADTNSIVAPGARVVLDCVDGHLSHDVPQSNAESGSGGDRKGSPTTDIQSSVALTPTYSPMNSAQLLHDEHSDKIHQSASFEPNDGPRIPLLNIFVTTPNKYPSPRAPTLAVESCTTQNVSLGVRDMPDLSDDEDSFVGDANSSPEMGSIFRKTQHHVDEDCGASEVIHACGSSDTEVASNIEGLKELDSFRAEPRRTTPSPFQQYRLDAVNGNMKKLSEWDVPLQKVESYKSTTDYSLSSNVSYFSYEDVSIASEELETCAICLCSYEEGDVRIFSKRCPHGEL